MSLSLLVTLYQYFSPGQKHAALPTAGSAVAFCLTSAAVSVVAEVAGMWTVVAAEVIVGSLIRPLWLFLWRQADRLLYTLLVESVSNQIFDRKWSGNGNGRIS